MQRGRRPAASGEFVLSFTNYTPWVDSRSAGDTKLMETNPTLIPRRLQCLTRLRPARTIEVLLKLARAEEQPA